MAISPMAAMKAYAAMSATGAEGGALTRPVGGAASPLEHFAELVERSVAGAEAQMSRAETLSAQAAVGQAELVDVVTAMAAAETSLETMLAVRDEVIRAYQDVMKMPI